MWSFHWCLSWTHRDPGASSGFPRFILAALDNLVFENGLHRRCFAEGPYYWPVRDLSLSFLSLVRPKEASSTFENSLAFSLVILPHGTWSRDSSHSKELGR